MTSTSSHSSSHRRKGSRLYATHDQWHVTSAVSSGGVVQERYAYEAFGKSIVLGSGFAPRSASIFDWETRFGAYRFDAESQLYCVRYRYLQTALGRWLSEDPIGGEGGLNLYRYVINSPVYFVDPLGLCGIFMVFATTVSGHGGTTFPQDYDGPGYQVNFHDQNCCPTGKLRLVQAISSDGLVFGSLFGSPWAFDVPKAGFDANRSTVGGVPYPGYTEWGGLQGNKPNSLQDSPETHSRIEICAVCDCTDGGRNKVVGCVRFEYDRKTGLTDEHGKPLQHLTPGGAAGSGFGEAEKHWNSHARK